MSTVLKPSTQLPVNGRETPCVLPCEAFVTLTSLLGVHLVFMVLILKVVLLSGLCNNNYDTVVTKDYYLFRLYSFIHFILLVLSLVQTLDTLCSCTNNICALRKGGFHSALALRRIIIFSSSTTCIDKWSKRFY